MKKLIIDGKEITTNLGGNYPIGDGNNTATMGVIPQHDARQTDREFVEELAKRGYKRITLKHCTTCVRGYYRLYALVKR